MSQSGPRADDLSLCTETPGGIKPVEMINRAGLQVVRVTALAQRGGDAGHYCRCDVCDMTCRTAMNMAAENRNDPPGMLQGTAQFRHDLPGFKVNRIRPYQDFKWRMVSKNRNRLGCIRVDHVDQSFDPRLAKVALVAV